MINFFVERKVTTLVLVIVCMLLGVVSFFNLNVEEIPKLDLPIVTIKTIYPGATPSEIETQIIKKIEDAVSEVSQIKRLKSTAYENFGMVIVEFYLEADSNIKSIEVKDKVDAIIDDLPEGAEKPIIEKFDPFAKSVVELILDSDKFTLTELYEYADKELKQKFTAITGVGSVDVYGGKERQINVKVNPELMTKHFITIDQVIKTIKLKNLNVPGGSIDQDTSSFGVRFMGEYATIDDVKNTIIQTVEGAKVLLSEIAIVEDSYKDQETVARFKDREAVGLSIIKLSDGNPLIISAGVRDVLPEVNQLLPEGMTITIAKDNSEYIQSDTLETQEGIVYGLILTIIILLIFTNNFRVTLVATLVIPFSIISTFLLMDISSFSINMMTLLAIATALGTLIANAIVVIENILKHIDDGEEPAVAAVKGTKEVLVSVLASVLTNLVVFTPIAFMEGVAGKFLKEFGMTVVYATLFSLMASLTLTPMLCATLLKKKEGVQKKPKIDQLLEWMLKQYRPVYDFILKYKTIGLLIALMVFVAPLSLVTKLGNEFLPKFDKNEITIDIAFSQGIVVEEAKSKIVKIESILSTNKYIVNYISRIGINGMENALITVKLVPFQDRDLNDGDIIQELIPLLARVEDTEFMLRRGSSSGAQNADIVINVFGDDYEKLITKTEAMLEVMKETGQFQSVRSSYKTPKNEIRFNPDQNRLNEYGIPNAAVGFNMRASIFGNDSNIYKENDEEYDINVQLMDEYITSIDDIKNISVMTRKGMIPISYLGGLDRQDSSPTIKRRDRKRVITLSGYLVKGSAGRLQPVLNKKFNKLGFDNRLYYIYSGDNENKTESESEMGKAFILAAILTFLVLAAILNSFVHPFTIGSTIITSFSGVVLFLYIFDFTINILALLAIIMLVGLVVNNAIILLEEAFSELKKQDNIKEALWIAISNKLKVVLMTSFAIIFSTVPQLLSPTVSKASMGAVIIGGMCASLLFTYILVPIVFTILETYRSKKS